MVDHWMKLASYSTAFEADRAKATLETAGIPAMIQSHAGAGIGGAGFQGITPGGVTLLVPSGEVDRAWRLVVEEG